MAKLSILDLDQLATEAGNAFLLANASRFDTSEIGQGRISLSELDVTLTFAPDHPDYSPVDNGLIVTKSALAFWKENPGKVKHQAKFEKWMKSLKWDEAVVVAERALNKIKDSVPAEADNA